MRRRELLLGLALLPACKRSSGAVAAPLVVLAAASLREVATELAARARDTEIGDVTVDVDATPRLAQRLRAGGDGDVFLSADEAWVQALRGDGHLSAEPIVELARGALVVVVPKGARGDLRNAVDLARAKTIAVAAPEVPAGRYAKQALTSLGVATDGKLVFGDSVRTALAWVARGEADAGIVYATDAQIEPKVDVAFALPESSHAPVRYLGAVVARSINRARAEGFLSLCAGEIGRAAFARAGFLPVAPRASTD